MYCNQCASYNCLHMQMGSMGLAQQQQSIQQYQAALRNYAGTEMANILGQEMAKEYVAKSSKKKLLLLRK